MNMRGFNCGLFRKSKGKTKMGEELLDSAAKTFKIAMEIHPSGAPQALPEIEAIIGNFTYDELAEEMFQPKGFLSSEDEILFGVLHNQVAATRVLHSQGYNIWEFAAVASALRQANHPNLLKVLGYCIDMDTRFVVYKFKELESLDRHLFDPKKEPLSWNTRMKIALGSAKGLEYLHKTMNLTHRNLSTKNVYLDAGFVPKLFDFGLPRRTSGWWQFNARPFCGDDGWLAPEFVHITFESDVYSFGILLLVILTGRDALDKKEEGWKSVADLARSVWNQDKLGLKNIVDSRMKQNYPEAGAYAYLRLAVGCIDPKPSSRPDISNVCGELERIASMSNDETAQSSGMAASSSAKKRTSSF